METKVKKQRVIRVKSLSELGNNVDLRMKPLRQWTEQECMNYIPRNNQLLVLDNTNKMSYYESIASNKFANTHKRIFMSKEEVELRNKFAGALGLDMNSITACKKVDNAFYMNVIKNGEERVINFNLAHCYADNLKFTISKSVSERLNRAIDMTIDFLSKSGIHKIPNY